MSQVLEMIIEKVTQNEDFTYFDFENEFDYVYRNGPKETLDHLMRCIYNYKGVLSHCLEDMKKVVAEIKIWENCRQSRKRTRVE